jgi:hypothetical protein
VRRCQVPLFVRIFDFRFLIEDGKGAQGIFTAVASQALHEMDAPSHETAARNVVAEYAEKGFNMREQRNR